MEDKFSLGQEIRGLLCLCLLVILVLMAFLNERIFMFLYVQTRLFDFLCALVFIPSLFYIQAIRPILLSIEHQRENKMHEAEAKQGESKKEVVSLKPEHSTAAERVNEILALLNDPEGRNLFLGFLESEFSIENLFFVEHCVLFKSKCSQYIPTPSQALLKELIDLIHLVKTTFIADTALSSVNVSSKNRKDIMEAVGKVKKIPGTENEEKVTDKQVWVNVDYHHLMVSTPFVSSRNSTELSESRKRKDSPLSLSLSAEKGNEKLIISHDWEARDLESLGIDSEMFEKGRLEILQMMASDSFLRFRAIEEYQHFLQRRHKDESILQE
jgi:hypothetical protein